MNCRQAERHLPGYLDGGNSSANHAALREHLSSCADCQLQLERYRRLVDLPGQRARCRSAA